jgi:hypothetical protein
MSTGKAIIEQLKQLIVDQMQHEPACAPTGKGLGNNELEELCDLALHLDSQDHYLTYSILQAFPPDQNIDFARRPLTDRLTADLRGSTDDPRGAADPPC